MDKCTCRVCTDWRRWIDVLNPQSDEAKHVLLNEIYGRLESAETDATYWRMKFEGTWPSDSADVGQK